MRRQSNQRIGSPVPNFKVNHLIFALTANNTIPVFGIYMFVLFVASQWAKESSRISI